MPVSSLFKVAQTKAMENANDINNLGDLPLETAEPIIRAVWNADTLRQIEKNGPQYKPIAIKQWQAMIERDIECEKDRDYRPKNPDSWGKLHNHLFKIQRDQLAKDEEDLRESFLAINTQKEKDRVTFATKTRSLADPPDYRGKDGKQRLLCERQHQKAKAQRIGPRPWGFVSMDLNCKGEIYANRSQAQGPMPAFFKKVYGSKARVYKTKTTTKSPVTVTPRPGVRLRGF